MSETTLAPANTPAANEIAPHNNPPAGGRIAVPQNEAERFAFINTFSPELRKALDWIQTWQQSEAAHSLRSRYSLGRYVKQIYDYTAANANGGVYGLFAIERLSAALVEDKKLLEVAKLFVEVYTPAQLDVLCSRVRADGETLRWSHVRQLVYVERQADRERLEAACVSECWTSADLAAEIKKVKGESGREGVGGRKLKMPSTPERHVNKVIEISKTETNRATAMVTDASISEMVSQLSVEEIDEELIKAMITAKRNLDNEILAKQKLRADYDKALIYANRLMARKRAQDGLAEEPESEEPAEAADKKGNRRRELVGV